MIDLDTPVQTLLGKAHSGIDGVVTASLGLATRATVHVARH